MNKMMLMLVALTLCGCGKQRPPADRLHYQEFKIPVDSQHVKQRVYLLRIEDNNLGGNQRSNQVFKVTDILNNMASDGWRLTWLSPDARHVILENATDSKATYLLQSELEFPKQ